eukprot:scaffold7802_cov71-Cyclotella_meneghiniana.AAC.27
MNPLSEKIETLPGNGIQYSKLSFIISMGKMINGQAAVVLLFLSLHTQSRSDELEFGAAVKSHQ